MRKEDTEPSHSYRSYALFIYHYLALMHVLLFKKLGILKIVSNNLLLL